MSDVRAPAFDIEASRTVAADAGEIFAFLADLENHWLIAGRFVDVDELTGPPGARTGGRVRVGGPLGLRRTAITRVEYAHPVREMGGSARLSGGTLAQVRWLLRPAVGRTHVTLGATIERATPVDRLLLTAGGAAWMRLCFAGALRALEDRLVADVVTQAGGGAAIAEVRAEPEVVDAVALRRPHRRTR